MAKSYNGQVHTNPDANGDGNDSEGFHMYYPHNDTKILGLLMCKIFLVVRG
jgi:hypothetical protein